MRRGEGTGDFPPGASAGKDQPRCAQPLKRISVPLPPFALPVGPIRPAEVRPFLPGDPKPAQIFHCRRSEFRLAARAVEIVKGGQHIDLVFTDVIMPGPVTSLQLGEVVRERLPQAQILYTSGYAEGVLAHEGKLEASVNLLQKPYHPDALSARIRHLLRRRHSETAV